MNSIKDVLVGFSGFCAIFVILTCVFFAISACLWPYTINTWLIYSGNPPCIEWWMGGLMGIVPGLGQSCIPAALITFILMLFI